MKRWALLLAVVGIAAWTGTGCAPPADEGGKGLAVAADAGAANELEVEKKLQPHLGKVAFDNTELGNVMDWFRQAAKLDIQVKWTVLETAGITPATLVKSVHLDDVTAESALMAVLDDVGGTTPLGIVVQGGYLLISTKDDLSGPRYRKTVIYDIRDLIPPVEAKVVIRRATESGSFGGEETESARVEAINNLCHLIARTVDRDSWMDPWGTGTVGVMTEYGGLLIVQQTWDNHQKIAALLADIRRHKPTFK